jgi:hypothetical protein
MVEIIEVAMDGSDGIIITFSDGTTAGYVVEELLEIRPIREKAPRNEVDGDRVLGG